MWSTILMHGQRVPEGRGRTTVAKPRPRAAIWRWARRFGGTARLCDIAAPGRCGGAGAM